MKCNCKICQRHEEFERQMNNLKEVVPFLQESGGVEEAIEFIEHVYTSLNVTEMDRDMNLAIIKGTWPESEEILARYRNG